MPTATSTGSKREKDRIHAKSSSADGALFLVAAAPRTLPAAALAATLGRLMTGPLPKPQDFEALAPVIGVAWARRVADLDLWVFFRFDDDEVTIIGLTARPPTRVES